MSAAGVQTTLSDKAKDDDDGRYMSFLCSCPCRQSYSVLLSFPTLGSTPTELSNHYDSTRVCSSFLHFDTYLCLKVYDQFTQMPILSLSIPCLNHACFTYTLLTRLTCSLNQSLICRCLHTCPRPHSVTVLIFKSELATKIASQRDGEGRGSSVGFLVTSEPT